MSKENIDINGTNLIAEALSKAQGEMNGAVKNKKNPYFKSDYADLGSAIAASKEALFDNGLSIVQVLEIREGQSVLVTRLLHSSGQEIQSEMAVPQTKDIQALGGALTYIRRYSLMAILGLAPVDDDGTAAVVSRAKFEEAKAVLKKEDKKHFLNAAQIHYLSGLIGDNDSIQEFVFKNAEKRQGKVIKEYSDIETKYYEGIVAYVKGALGENNDA